MNHGGMASDTNLMSTAELAAYLGVPVATVHQWRHKGTGPEGIRVGKHVRYRPSAVESWLDAQSKTPAA